MKINIKLLLQQFCILILISGGIIKTHQTTVCVKKYNKIKPSFFCWPIKPEKCWISSTFGPRKKPNGLSSFHHGVDMAAFTGTPVKASAAGVIKEAYFSTNGYGKTILINHKNEHKTRYAHLDKILVCVGQKVSRGELIGKVGKTGNVRSRTGNDPSHLHFEIHTRNKRINPLDILPKKPKVA